ncbi:MAG: aldehyde dehydrogenase family protein [Candidatus Thermoplasmatota archaeon]|nr:aldehyde dehydrogenase family protein [Candidatus Thermoplasmatota archaeon]
MTLPKEIGDEAVSIRTVNPYSGEKLNEYEEEAIESVAKKIHGIRVSQSEWKRDLGRRIDYVGNTLLKNLKESEREMAESMTLEMGKPISQSLAEVRKCFSLLDFYLEKASSFLEPEQVKTDAARSYIRFDPIGVVMLVMPWNYPLWQVMRAAVPALIAGNGVVLKHASIVSGTSLLIQRIFDTPLFKSVILKGPDALEAIRYVDGVSFTGSTAAGSKIAEKAGSLIRKSVLELGGSDPFIVLDGADIRKTAKHAAIGRLQNAGQSCIASKRFIVSENVYDEFQEELRRQFSSVAIGDPMKESTFLGPLSSAQQAETVRKQIQELGKLGPVHPHGGGDGNVIHPVIASPSEPYDEEIFGPVAVLRKFRNSDEAVRLANETPFGLGCSIWGDADEAEKLAPFIDAGMVFVNKIVASDPRVPFGGVKKSGYGRELSRYGLLEFTNLKTTWIEKSPQ